MTPTLTFKYIAHVHTKQFECRVHPHTNVSQELRTQNLPLVRPACGSHGSSRSMAHAVMISGRIEARTIKQI